MANNIDGIRIRIHGTGPAFERYMIEKMFLFSLSPVRYPISARKRKRRKEIFLIPGIKTVDRRKERDDETGYRRSTISHPSIFISIFVLAIVRSIFISRSNTCTRLITCDRN